MRIRILKLSTGIVDGVSLSHLLPGLVYEGTLAIPLEHASGVVTGGVTVSVTIRDEDIAPRRRPTDKER